MKNKLFAFMALAFFSTFNAQLSTAFAQGSLTPPGAPAPTMKTLDQIEPRTPISSLPFSITSSGSYYVTTNLTVTNTNIAGIAIYVSDVTIDLAGRTLIGVGSGANNVGLFAAGGIANLAIRDGTIRNWGSYGVGLGGVEDCRITGLRLLGNGQAGLITGTGTVVSQCQAATNRAGGISTGDGSVLSDCVALNNIGMGIAAGSGASLRNCAAAGNTSFGFSGGNGATFAGCAATANGSSGLAAAPARSSRTAPRWATADTESRSGSARP